ncbi:MAG TPA: hypothetical protein VF214_01440 [Edaphobacter sp.]
MPEAAGRQPALQTAQEMWTAQVPVPLMPFVLGPSLEQTTARRVLSAGLLFVQQPETQGPSARTEAAQRTPWREAGQRSQTGENERIG